MMDLSDALRTNRGDCRSCNSVRVIVSQKFTAPGNVFSGKTRLKNRLYNIEGFQVQQVSVNLLQADVSPSQGRNFFLKSTILGQNSENNSFQVVNLTNVDVGICDSDTDIIAMGSFSTGTRTITVIDSHDCKINSPIFFMRPRTLDGFDWRIESPGNPLLAASTAYCIEIIIKFFVAT